MTPLERRLARLEAAQGNDDGLTECELSEEGKELLRCTLAGLYSPEEIERIVSANVLTPRREFSPAAREQLEEVIAALGAPLP
jgi:hypothetical protein